MTTDKKTGSAVVGILLIILIIVGDLLTGAASSRAPTVVPAEQCLNPPGGTPNKCHIYTWSPFPVDVGVTPGQGLFNNDTSYYFNLNATGFTAFQICANFLSPLPNNTGNATLVLQFYNGTVLTIPPHDTGQWANVDPTQAGAWSPFHTLFNTETAGCGPIGHFGLQASTICAPWAADGNAFPSFTGCGFRIAGNEGDDPLGIVSDSMILTQLYVQFYYSTSATNHILCTQTSITVTGFTNTCNRIIAIPTSQVVSIRWQADNLTNAGLSTCIVRNCFRGPAISSCTIPANGVSCTNAVTFSPAFSGVVRISEITTPLNSGTASITGTTIAPLLT